MKQKRPSPKCDLPPLALGSPVVIKRPHLWSGASGSVLSYDATTTLHRIRMKLKQPVVPGEGFNYTPMEYCHTDALATELEPDWMGMLG